jgi:hypothetical protein
MVGPVETSELIDLVRRGKTAKVGKASQDGDQVGFCRTSLPSVLRSAERTAQVQVPGR